ncbi:MAG: DUF502 domain-containing protein [Gammaproteobacteria bacterium]|jgi:uncharacterized membrane protein|nr:DUF502 domain-containing protein [Gammaproteobacteria bacterium]
MTPKIFWQTMVTGMFVILPLLITVYLVVWFGQAAESAISALVKLFIPDRWYVPGAGIVIGILIVFSIGLMAQSWIMRRAIDYGEQLLYNIPVVKGIYSSLKDLTEFFTRPGKEDFHEVVMVDFDIGGHKLKLMGFVTSRKNVILPTACGGDDMIMVYLPMSYQIGGYTITVPAEAVTRIAMSMDDAMRYVLTAGLAQPGGRHQGGSTILDPAPADVTNGTSNPGGKHNKQTQSAH